MEVVVTTGAIVRAELHHQQTNTLHQQLSIGI